uniref:EamA family transporter n=1 Tax=Angelakisella sp. TaxID=1935177 RepID=UPI003FEE3D27
MNKKIRQNLFPVLAAFIWGTAFVAQSVGSEYVPPLTFGAIRCSMAFAALALGLWIVRMVQKKKAPEKVEPLASSPKDLVLGGICCGVALAMASFLQQSGISGGTSAGKAGFITALYIVLVPILGLFLRKKVTIAVWISVVLDACLLYTS